MRLTVPDVLPFFILYHSRNGAWGSLHIVLSDGNEEDSSVAFCRQWARENNDVFGGALAILLLEMSRTQRGKINYLVHRYEHEQRKAKDAPNTSTGD